MTKLKTLKMKLIDTIYEFIYKQEKPDVYLQSLVLEDMLKKHFENKNKE